MHRCIHFTRTTFFYSLPITFTRILVLVFNLNGKPLPVLVLVLIGAAQ